MYNYKIAYSDYGEYSSFELTHKEKFSKEELQKIIERAIITVYDNLNPSEKAYIDKIASLFFDYRFICELHKLGFENLIYESAIELENVNLFNRSYPLCGPTSFRKAKMDKCEYCQEECSVKNSNLNVVCSEFGVIVEEGGLNGE